MCIRDSSNSDVDEVVNFIVELYFDPDPTPAVVYQTRTTVHGFPHDPNYKKSINMTELSHSNELSKKYGETEQYIIYEVQFHNEGTGFAKNVIVKDILPPEIDPNSINILRSDAVVELNGTEFHFNNINLPGLAMGYEYEETISKFIFSACIIDHIIPNDCITNNIEIFFDNQPPVPAKHTICANEHPDNIPFTNGNPCSLQPSRRNKIADDSRKVLDLKVYPNPASQNLFIDIPDNLEIVSSRLFRANGKLVMQDLQFNQDTPSINLNSLQKGMYFLVLDTNDGIVTRKFIKE